MASIRELKKDIDYLVFEVVSDCLTFSSISGGDKNEEITSIVEEAVDLRNRLFSKINTRPGKGDDKSGSKQHFKEVRKELFQQVDSLFTRLSDLSGEKA